MAIFENSAPSWGAAAAWHVDPEPNLVIGRADGDPRYLLDLVRWPQRLPDGRVIAPNLRSNVIQVYGPDGTWQATIGRTGSGPGEFTLIGGVWVNEPDTILVFDENDRRISRHTADGRFLREEQLQSPLLYGNWLGVLADGTLVFGGGPETRQEGPLSRDSLRFGLITKGSNSLAEVGIVPALERYRYDNGDQGVLPFTPYPFLDTFQDEIFVTRSDAAEVRVLGPAGERRIIRWVPPTSGSTFSVRAELREAVLRERPADQHAYFEQRLTQMPDRPLPVLGGLVVDALGNVWARHYSPLEDNQWIGSVWANGLGGDWWVFTPDGTWLGSVAMPAGLKPFEIGGDYVLGVHFDSLEVQTVRVHALRR